MHCQSLRDQNDDWAAVFGGNMEGHSQAVDWHLCRCACVGVHGMHTSSSIHECSPQKSTYKQKEATLVIRKYISKKTPPPLTIIITLRDIQP